MDFQYLIWLMMGIGFIYYLKQVKTATKEQRSRIMDFLIIGSVVAITPFFTEHKGWVYNMKLTGGLVFAYGWFLLIIDRFKAGYKE